MLSLLHILHLHPTPALCLHLLFHFCLIECILTEMTGKYIN